MTLSDALDTVYRKRWSAQKDGGVSRGRAQRCLLGLPARPRNADLRRLTQTLESEGLGPATINRHLSALSAVLVEAGLALDMPWRREPRGRTRWLTREEVRHLAQACLRFKHGQAVAALVRFLAETGLRVGEALELAWADCPADAGGQRTGMLVRTSKNGEARTVPLTRAASDAVELALDQAWGGQGGPWRGLSQSTVNHVFRQARDSVAGLAGDVEVVPHTLRHTAASRLVAAGISMPVVQAWLGHRDYRSTLRYVHVDQEGLQTAARRLEEWV